MLRTIRKLLGEKSNQIKFPIALMGADAVLSIVLYVVLYMTVIQLLGNTLTAGKIVIYTAICFISVINKKSKIDFMNSILKSKGKKFFFTRPPSEQRKKQELVTIT